MSFLTINNKDVSNLVSSLKVAKAYKYNSQTNAAGNTVVDLINVKRTIEVGFITTTAAEMQELLNTIDTFGIVFSFRNPNTNQLEENINGIIPNSDIEYYTIQQNNVLYKAMKIKIIEL